MFTYVTGVFDIYQAPSNIEGQGMFAGKPFKKGDLIGLAHSNGQPASQLGRMHNHDENSPTMISKKSGNDRFVFAAKDLQPGDELTTNYRMQPELEQPEQFQNGGSVMVPPRKGVRKNPDGSESTHLMATETLDGKNWFSFPTLFQDPDGTWIDMSDKPWQEAYEEAKKRGEVIEFGTDKEAAIKFGEGSWKLPKAQQGKQLPPAVRDMYPTEDPIYYDGMLAETTVTAPKYEGPQIRRAFPGETDPINTNFSFMGVDKSGGLSALKGIGKGIKGLLGLRGAADEVFIPRSKSNYKFPTSKLKTEKDVIHPDNLAFVPENIINKEVHSFLKKNNIDISKLPESHVWAKNGTDYILPEGVNHDILNEYARLHHNKPYTPEFRKVIKAIEELNPGIKITTSHDLHAVASNIPTNQWWGNKVNNFKKGGSLPKAQNGNGEVVSLSPSDPRYAEYYNRLNDDVVLADPSGKTAGRIFLDEVDVVANKPKPSKFNFQPPTSVQDQIALQTPFRFSPEGIAAGKSYQEYQDYINSLPYDQRPGYIQPTISEYVPPSTGEWLWDKISNPMTSLGYVVRGQTDIMPDRLGNSPDRNIIDYAVDVINPASYANTVVDMGEKIGEGDIVGAGLDAITLTPIVPTAAKQGTKLFKRSVQVGNKYVTPLSHKRLYQFNPLANQQPPFTTVVRTQMPGQTGKLVMGQYYDDLANQGKKLNWRQNLDRNSSRRYGWGRGFSSDPADISNYSNPSFTSWRGYDPNLINPELLIQRLPTSYLDDFKVANLSSDARKAYGSGKSDVEFILPIDDVISAESRSLSKEAYDEIRKIRSAELTPHWWKGFQEVKQDGGEASKIAAQQATGYRPQATISQYEEPAWYEKAADYLASPMTALSYIVQGKDLPDRIPINAENRNTYDMAFDMINPAAWAAYAESADKNLKEGNYTAAAFDALGAIPVIPSSVSQGRNVVKVGAKSLPKYVKNVPVGNSDLLMTHAMPGLVPGIKGTKDGVLIAQAAGPRNNHMTLKKFLDATTGQDYYSFTESFIDNPMLAGRALKMAEDLVPKGSILKQAPGGTLSQDSFNLMTRRLGDTRRFRDLTNYDADYINLNEFAKGRNRLGRDAFTFSQSDFNALNAQYMDVFNNLGISEFRGLGSRQVPVLNLGNKGYNIFEIPGLQSIRDPRALEKYYNVSVPNITLQKLYQKGGEKTSWLDYANPFNWGVYTYDDAGTFGEAFAKAREEDQDQFMYYGDRYTTELAPTPEVKEEPKEDKLFYNKDILKGLSEEQVARRQSLLNAANTVASAQGDDDNLRKLLVMSAVMENTLGADPKAYGRDYTRSPMSIDDVAYDDLFNLREGAKGYTAQQKKNAEWLEGLGINTSDVDSLLRADDPMASMAVARLIYGRAPEALPSGDDPDALYNYYLKYYNKGGVDKYGGAEAHRKKFNDYYNQIYREFGGETDQLKIYKDYVYGVYDGTEMQSKAEKIYDKLNRVYYKEAKQSGTTVPNYILTKVMKQSDN
jgi:hypothetical protein